MLLFQDIIKRFLKINSSIINLANELFTYIGITAPPPRRALFRLRKCRTHNIQNGRLSSGG